MTMRHTLASVALLIIAGGSAVSIHRAATPVAHHEPRGHRGASPAASVAAASTQGSPHIALGTPVDADPTDDHVIVRNRYAVSYNHHRNGPNWAAWRLTAQDIGGQERHRGHFVTDDSLPRGWYRVTHDDYTGSGYDRGHLVRSKDRSTSSAANDATFLLTNVAPQSPALNHGPWLRLEDHCRKLAQHDGRTVYVVAGVVYGQRGGTIGHGVAVPVAWWKVVVVVAEGQGADDVTAATPVLAAVMPNSEHVERGWQTYQVTLGEVERRSGYRLLVAVAAPVVAALRAR